jgi:hypothetical protein
MKLLTAVNRILPVLGEHAVTSLSTKHPTLAILLPIIQTTLDDLTIQGYWFNTFKTKLYQDSEGGIGLPLDTLSFVPDYENAIQRGTKLFNGETMSYVWSLPVDGVIVTRVPFDELPESVATFIFYNAMVVAYVTDIGLEQTVQIWQALAGAAERRVMSEHLRNRKYTTQRSPRYQRIRAAMRA